MELISAGILAGGKSSRMGENKARLKYKKDTFLETVAKACSDFYEIMVSVDDKAKYSDLPYRLVEDEKKGYGPLEGIYQLLKASKTEYLLVVATDMPCIRKQTLNKLAALVTGDEDCLILCVNGKIQPLCSIYSKKILYTLEKLREREEHRPRELYRSVITKYIELEELGEEPLVVDNINTKADYEAMMNAERRQENEIN
jgi:molybdopterin-guanine dinucleotide biosynthesis protein A